MKTSNYLTAQQRSYMLTRFFQTWQKGCKYRQCLWGCTDLKWAQTHNMRANSCSFGRKKKIIFLCTVWNLPYLKPVLPANNSLFLTEETLNTCVNMIHALKKNEEKGQEEPGLIREDTKR